MAPSARKKLKTRATATSPPTPIVFQSSGLQPDLRLVVFDQEFHVHSVLLKIYSAFFRKFLDSPDKETAIEAASTGALPARLKFSTPTKFKYEWVTKLDNDAESTDEGNWHLVAASSTLKEPIDLSAYKGDKEYQSRAFEKLLYAMYLKPYKIESCMELMTMTELADYYCALPVLSRTLDGAFLRSPAFVGSIRDLCCETLALATKLRNSTLFRESLVWVLGPWGEERWETLEDPKLKKIAKLARHELSHKISKVQEAIISIIEFAGGEDNSLIRESALEAREDNGGYLNMPRYFQKLCKREAIHVFMEDCGESLDMLMISNLVLEQHRAGKGFADGHFLCVSIDDEDLPWDITEMDW